MSWPEAVACVALIVFALWCAVVSGLFVLTLLARGIAAFLARINR